MKAFLSLKFYDGKISKPLIDGITNALKPLDIETFCAARDIEKYGEAKNLDMEHFMPKYAFPNIENSDLFIVEYSEKGVGLGIGACHAYDSDVPVYIIAKPGSDISTTINSLAAKVIFYKDFNDLREQFSTLIKNNQLKTKSSSDKRIVRNLIEQYQPFNKQEEIDKKSFLQFIDSFDDVLTRDNLVGHFSATAFVVTEDFKKAVLIHHNIFNGFIEPGGHADGDPNLLAVAKREVEEETGLIATPYSNKPFAIKADAINAHIKHGKPVPSHIHYDVLFLMTVKNSDMNKVRILESENSAVKWVDLDETYADDVVEFVRPDNKKIIEKIRKEILCKK